MSETGSVRARDRTIKEWFRLIEAGTLKLPRFQRHEAWDTSTVVGLLETVLRGLPAGATLVLNVGQPEPFVSRYLVDRPRAGNAGHGTSTRWAAGAYRDMNGVLPDARERVLPDYEAFLDDF